MLLWACTAGVPGQVHVRLQELDGKLLYSNRYAIHNAAGSWCSAMQACLILDTTLPLEAANVQFLFTDRRLFMCTDGNAGMMNTNARTSCTDCQGTGVGSDS